MPPSRGDLAGARAAAAALDARTYRAVRAPLLRHERVEGALLAVIRVQNLWALASAGAVVFAGRQETRQAWVRANIRMTAAFATAKLVRRVVARPRPDFPDCPPARTKGDRESFPSTHVAVAFAAAAAVPPLLPAEILVGVAAATCAARVLLGEHYPSDVAAGAILGVAVARAL